MKNILIVLNFLVLQWFTLRIRLEVRRVARPRRKDSSHTIVSIRRENHFHLDRLVVPMTGFWSEKKLFVKR